MALDCSPEFLEDHSKYFFVAFREFTIISLCPYSVVQVAPIH